MRNNLALAASMLAGPEPMVWAILLLPTGSALKGSGPMDTWKRTETSTNGGFYERGDGLRARCRGVQLTGGSRWLHVVLGIRKGVLSQDDVRAAVDAFFPPHAMVMQAFLPDAFMGAEELEGSVAHLWWAVDGDAGVPPVSEWERDAELPLAERAPTHD